MKGKLFVVSGTSGSGKSTICKTIMGDPNYIVTSGNINYLNEDLLSLPVNERSKKGIFLLNQLPIEIPGVSNAEMLRIALAEKTGKNVSIFDFNKKMETICAKLNIPKSFIHRGINEGMSGGEKKKNELLHLWMLEPKLIILDELDSGLDVDSLKTVCQNILDYVNENPDVSILIISHHIEILKQLNANYIHVLSNGNITTTGNIDLALDIEKNGFSNYIKTNVIEEKVQNE